MKTPSEDRAVMTDPRRWPLRPYLPLKNINHRWEPDGLGVLIESNGKVLPIVYITNVCEPDLKSCSKVNFASFDDLLANDWRVD